MTFDVQRHNEEVKQLREDFRQRKNSRVPVFYSTDENIWLAQSGHSFREFYLDAKVNLEVQLDGQKWLIDNVVHDLPMQYPDRWSATPRIWMFENEFFGAEVVHQEDDYAWAKPLDESKEDMLARIADIDPPEQIRKGLGYRLYVEMKELADGMEFEGRPVHIGPPGIGTHGIFTKACELRGIENFCADLLEDPDFSTRFLALITKKTVERMQAWHDLAETGRKFPNPGGGGMPDDSLQLISAQVYERMVLPHHRTYYEAITTGSRSMHLCGFATQHFRVLHEKLGIRLIDGPGPFADHGAWMEELGPDFAFNAQMEHTDLHVGSVSRVVEMVKGILKPKANKPGRFQLVGYIDRHASLDLVQTAYEAGKEYGVCTS